ncbi:MAG: hypothetical protein RLZZ546_2236 [Bacteroidota bacterium]|jgi:hypothetical protein
MKKILFFVLFLGAFISLNATNSGKIKQNKEQIEQQFTDIEKVEKIILEEGLTYSELAAKYPELVATNKIASENEDGIFENGKGTPLNIPGFWWGFCLGWVGMLIVYLTMDEGSTRKEQVMNALWGCIISSVIGVIFYVAFWAVLFGTVN